VSGSREGGRLLGDALAIAMAGFFALATVLVRRRPDIPMIPAAASSALLAALLATTMAAPLSTGPRDLALLAVFGVGQFGAGFLLFMAGARLLPVAETSLIGTLETVLGPLWVWLAIGETAGGRSLVGGAIILGALVTHTTLDLTTRRRPA
jgi:drug/metabolite transporter (DMT)-like permease